VFDHVLELTERHLLPVQTMNTHKKLTSGM